MRCGGPREIHRLSRSPATAWRQSTGAFLARAHPLCRRGTRRQRIRDVAGIAEELAAERDGGAITIVCQSTLSEFADDAIRTAIKTLKETRGVELIDRFLPSTEYDDLIAGCDLILLPYDADQYRSRLSAIFVDATCAGVPVVVPEGTWMSRQLEEGLAAGGAFATLSPHAITTVVRQLLPRLGAVKGDAHAASTRAVAQHDPRAVLRALLES